MVALREKIPSFLPEQLTAIPRRVKSGLAKVALRTERFYDERIGPSADTGRHVLHDDDYHHSVARYLDKAKEDAKAAKEAAKLAAKEGTAKPKVDRRPDINLMPAHYQYDAPVDTDYLIKMTEIERDNRYLFTNPDTHVRRAPPIRRDRQDH